MSNGKSIKGSEGSPTFTRISPPKQGPTHVLHARGAQDPLVRRFKHPNTQGPGSEHIRPRESNFPLALMVTTIYLQRKPFFLAAGLEDELSKGVFT